MRPNIARPQALKHLAFFEVLASVPEGSEQAKLATAGLLTLRMVDHWVLAGAAIVEPESVSVRSVRQAIMALPPREAVRESLLTIVNTMQMLRQVDLVPVLPRIYAFAQLLDRHHGSFALAADCYESVIRLADPECDAELVMDAYHSLAFCQRKVGALDASAQTALALVKLATRKKDRARVLRGRMGSAQVSMIRGDLAEADSVFASVADEAEKHELHREFSVAMHNRSVVAFRADRATDAVILAHRALTSASDPVARDRVLGDLAAFLIKLEDFDAALDALHVLELTGASEEPRLTARVNILTVAARAGNRELFDSARERLEGTTIPLEAQVNMLIERGRGFFNFGEEAAALADLQEAERMAAAHGLRPALSEITELRATGSAIRSTKPALRAATTQTREVAATLKQMAATIAA